VMLHTEEAGRAGFAAEGAPIPVRALGL